MPDAPMKKKDRISPQLKGWKKKKKILITIMITTNREQWLQRGVDILRPYIKEKGYEIPEVRVSCGWPSSGGLSANRKLGECWHSTTAKDGIKQIYISPVLDEPIKVLDVLTHQLGHAALEDGVGYKKPFKRYCTAVGLEGPAKATVAGNELRALLEEVLEQLTDELGPYPQSAITQEEKDRKRQKGRMLKLFCPANEDHKEDYIVRAAKKTLEIGIPTCPCGKEFEVEEKESEDDGE